MPNSQAPSSIPSPSAPAAATAPAAASAAAATTAGTLAPLHPAIPGAHILATAAPVSAPPAAAAAVRLLEVAAPVAAATAPAAVLLQVLRVGAASALMAVRASCSASSSLLSVDLCQGEQRLLQIMASCLSTAATFAQLAPCHFRCRCSLAREHHAAVACHPVAEDSGTRDAMQ